MSVVITNHRGSKISPERFAILSQVAFLHFIASNRSLEHLRGKQAILSYIVGMGNI